MRQFLMIAALSATIASCSSSAGNPGTPGASASSDSPSSIPDGTWSAVTDGKFDMPMATSKVHPE